MNPPKMSCNICYQEESLFLKNCKHSYCIDCLSKWIIIKNSCPVCRQEINIIDQVKCFNYLLKIEKITRTSKIYYDLNDLPEDDILYLIEILNDVFPEFHLYNPFTEEEFEQIKEKINEDSHAKKIFESINIKILNKYSFNEKSKKLYYILIKE